MQELLHLVADDLDIDVITEVLPSGRIYLLAQAEGGAMFTRLLDMPSDELAQRRVLERTKAELAEYASRAKAS